MSRLALLLFSMFLGFALPALACPEGQVCACDGDAEEAAACAGPKVERPELKELSLDEAADAHEAGARFVDANGEGTRTKLGVIPGALLLSSSVRYEPKKELPADKSTPLVFYCMNSRCSAAGQAALRALEAGYSKVSVFPEGISGWTKAGGPTEKPRR